MNNRIRSAAINSSCSYKCRIGAPLEQPAVSVVSSKPDETSVSPPITPGVLSKNVASGVSHSSDSVNRGVPSVHLAGCVLQDARGILAHVVRNLEDYGDGSLIEGLEVFCFRASHSYKSSNLGCDKRVPFVSPTPLVSSTVRFRILS